MASGNASEIRSGTKRIRSFLGIRTGAIDYYSHKNPRGEDDLWDGDATIQQTGYLTDLLGDRAVRVDQRLRETGAAVPVEPAFQRAAALAMGSAGRSGGIRTAARDAVAALRWGDATDLRAHGAGDGYANWPCAPGADVNGLTDDTIVVFTSDNGGERFSDTWPFTGIKTELLEGGLRVPAVLCWPARRSGRAGQRAGGDHHGLVPDVAGSGPAWNSIRIIRRTGSAPAADADRSERSGAAHAVLGVTRPISSGPECAMGDFKYLKIQQNTFLFNVVDDPRERANLKQLRKDVFEPHGDGLVRMETATNCAEIADSFGEVLYRGGLADHIGAR